MKKGTYPAAIDRFESVLKTYPEYKKQDKLLFSLGLSYKKSGLLPKATETFTELINRFPSSPEAIAAKKEIASPKIEKK